MTELEFGDRLRRYRKSKNMTQQELAERLGVSDKSVSRWENGSYPDVAMLGPLAKELGVTVDDLLGTAPPLRKLERSDLQNWLSFGFAIGGGILFFALNIFLPTLLCYAAYLGLMAYGVYLQKNYTFHSKWFHIGNLVMNFFVNTQLAGAVLALLLVLDGLSMTTEYAERIMAQIVSGGIGGQYALLLAAQPVLALALTALTGWCVRRWWQGTMPPIRPGFSPKNLTFAKALPMVFPFLLAGWLMLFSYEHVLPIWAYQHQGTVYMALWAASAVLTALVLLLSRHPVMLLPAAFMQLGALLFPRMCRCVRSVSLDSGNFYDRISGLNPNKYQRFLEAAPDVLLLAAVFAAGYLLCGCVKLWDSPPKAEKPGDDTPM